MIDIQPRHLTLTQLLDGRLFTIPDYQRAYSWSSRERRDLFDDIENIFKKDSSEGHFMATVVCLKRKSVSLGTDRYDQLDIVDGQQRLTTIILLINAIGLALNDKKPRQKRAKQEIEELLVKVDGDNLLLLQTNQDTSHYFADYVRDGRAASPSLGNTLADRELLLAIKECNDFVAQWISDNDNALDLYACLKNQLSFILHEISDEKIVYTVFEVLNSRGMEVNWIDRLKSILMGKAFEIEVDNRDQLIKDLHHIWRDIYTQVGLRQGLSTEALRFAATLSRSTIPHRPLSERDSVDTLRDKAIDAENIRSVARWLLRVTEACDKVISDRRQNAVTRIAQARLLAVSIHLGDNFSSTERKKLLTRWEKVSFRIYGMCGWDARTRVGDYVRLAWNITQENVGAKAALDEIGVIGEDYPIDDAISSVEDTNCYEGWEDELRYFLFRYEEFLSKEKGLNFKNEQWERIWELSPIKSIEHIVPQSKAPDKIKHRLGNLMMLPPNLNSRLQDSPPTKKLGAYRDTGLITAQEVASDWSWTKSSRSKSVGLREQKILQWAREEWDD